MLKASGGNAEWFGSEKLSIALTFRSTILFPGMYVYPKESEWKIQTSTPAHRFLVLKSSIVAKR